MEMISEKTKDEVYQFIEIELEELICNFKNKFGVSPNCINISDELCKNLAKYNNYVEEVVDKENYTIRDLKILSDESTLINYLTLQVLRG